MNAAVITGVTTFQDGDRAWDQGPDRIERGVHALQTLVRVAFLAAGAMVVVAVALAATFGATVLGLLAPRVTGRGQAG